MLQASKFGSQVKAFDIPIQIYEIPAAPILDHTGPLIFKLALLMKQEEVNLNKLEPGYRNGVDEGGTAGSSRWGGENLLLSDTNKLVSGCEHANSSVHAAVSACCLGHRVSCRVGRA